MIRSIVLGITLSAAASLAYSYEVLQGSVGILQPTYMPDVVSFTLVPDGVVRNFGSASCPLGTWLQWKNPVHSNNQTVYDSLLSAKRNGNLVRLYVAEGDRTCTGLFIHFE